MAEYSASDLINQVMTANKQSAGVLTAGQAEIGRLGDQASASFNTYQSGMQGAIAGAEKVAGDKAAIEYTRDQTIQNIQKLYGMDPQSADFVVAKDMAEYNAARTERKAVREEYDALSQVSLISNPLGWIVAQTRLPQVASRNNALADREDDALTEISDLTSRLAASKSTITANTADAVRANSLQAAAVQSQVSNAELALKQGENAARVAGFTMQKIQLADKLNDNTKSAIATIASVQNMEETRRMRQDASARDKKNDELRNMQIQTLLDEKKAIAEQDAELDSRLKVVSDHMGLQTPMTMRRIRVLLNKKEQEKWVNLATTAKYGEDVGEAVPFYLERGNMQVVQNSGGASVVDLARKLRDAGRAEADAVSYQYGTAKLTNPTIKVPNAEGLEREGYTQYENRIVSSAMKPLTEEEQKKGVRRADLSSKEWDKTFNPYVAPLLSFSAAINSQPELAGLKNNLVKQQIDALVTAGTITSDNLTSQQQAQVVTSLQQQILGGKINSKKAAADLNAYFKSAAAYNLQLSQYTSFALPTQNKYLYTQPDSGPQADLFDPVSTENMLVRGAKNMARDRFSSTGSTPFGYR